jgi:hypothetical protein
MSSGWSNGKHRNRDALNGRNQMTKTAAILFAIGASVALAVGGAAPALAAPNNGSFEQSAEADTTDLCDTLKGYFQTAYSKSRAAKDKKTAAKYRDLANGHLEDAWGLGCDWAQ